MARRTMHRAGTPKVVYASLSVTRDSSWSGQEESTVGPENGCRIFRAASVSLGAFKGIPVNNFIQMMLIIGEEKIKPNIMFSLVH